MPRLPGFCLALLVVGLPVAAAQQAERAQFISAQDAEQFLASKFRGTDVIGPSNEKIGIVADVLFDKQGKVVAYVIGVGGFLGIGAKEIALTPASFQTQQAGTDVRLKLELTKDEVIQAREFKPYRPPRK